MPELPEVETIRRDLHTKIVNKKIVEVEIKDIRAVKMPAIKFCRFLVGIKIKNIERRGKLLILSLNTGKFLLIHLKMTGQLIYVIEKVKGLRNQKELVVGGHQVGANDLILPNKHTRIIFNFVDGAKLYFNDLRMFGYLKIVDKREKERIVEQDYGIESDKLKVFKVLKFIKLFENKKTTIKAFLLNQKIIAGIGNIYADEICYCVRVKPSRRVNELLVEEIKKLYICIPKVLELAIKNRGTTFKDFVDGEGKKGGHVDFLKVYQKNGTKCRRCGSTIVKIRLGGRGTHFCPGCQI